MAWNALGATQGSGAQQRLLTLGHCQGLWWRVGPWNLLPHPYTLLFKLFPQPMGERQLLWDLEYHVLKGKMHLMRCLEPHGFDPALPLLTCLTLSESLNFSNPLFPQFRWMVLRVLPALKSSSSGVSDWILETWGKPSALLPKVDPSNKIMDRRGIGSKLSWGWMCIS